MARQRASQAREAFGRIGVAAVPPPETGLEPPAPSSDPEPVPSRDAVTSRRQFETYRPSRKKGAPRVGDSVAFTVRFSPDEAFENDEMATSLSRRAGRRLDKSDVDRTLWRLARSRPEIREALLDELRNR